MLVTQHFALWMLGLASPETQTSDHERRCLAHHAKGKQKLVEIGVWHGVTTCVLRAAMDPSGELLCVDPYPVGSFGFSVQQVIAQCTVSKIRNGRVRWIRKTGEEAGSSYSDSAVDFIFIDADHSYDGLKGDWEAWNEHIAIGGVVALHDSISSVERNIEDAGSLIYTREVVSRDQRFALVDIVDTLTVLKRLG
jgi:predicted O-methyltransferase YrrM